jgi:hypothetical protein
MIRARTQIEGLGTSREEKEVNKTIGEMRAAVRGALASGLLLLVTAMALLGAAGLPQPARAAAPAMNLRIDVPDTVAGGPHETVPGQKGQRFAPRLGIENSGNAPMSGPLTATITVPPELSIVEGFFLSSGPTDGECKILANTLSCTVAAGEFMLPDSKADILYMLELDPSASGDLTIMIEVSGGGVPDPITVEEKITVGPPNPFTLKLFDAAIKDADGNDDTQAGAAPGSAGTTFEVPTYAAENLENPFIFFLSSGVSGHFRNAITHLPAGMISNFGATPSRCTPDQLATNLGQGVVACPHDSQVGVAHVKSNLVEPVYAMVTPPGVPAQFAFQVAGVLIPVNARLRPNDFGVDLVAPYTNTTLSLEHIRVTLWGVPADPSHDTSRPECLAGENGHNGGPETCPIDAPRRAFIRLPTSCSGPLQWGMDLDSYEEPDVYHSRTATTPAQVGCNQLEFTPSIKAKPSTTVADSPSGLELNLHLPQNEDPDGLAEAHLKDLKLRLPEGIVVNSASADGLEACSPSQIGLETPVGQLPARFNGDVPSCPNASKVGSVLVNTPAIDHKLPGTLYLASQGQNPFGSLLALYLVINDPPTGVVIKVPIRADLDQNTGQLTTVVQESPQQPFEDLTIELDKGAHAPLRTPISCGRFTTTSQMTPWTAPEGQDAHPSDTFEVSKGAGGKPCAGSAGEVPFDPAFEAGTLEPKAGAFSPYSIKISRADGTQELGAIDIKLPQGLLASLRGIPYCSDGALASVPRGLGTGKAEIAHPSCSLASQIGSVSAAVGAGPNPLNVHTGKAYWAGPYKGAPVSMAVIFPAVAGPFDLGNVVVRTGFYVDPETAQITARSDTLPHILGGIPLDLRSVRINLDRPNYGLNPTSCNPMSIEADLSSSLGATVHRSQRFQVGGCDNLSFKPKLALRLKGGTKRAKYPALTATLTFPKNLGANTAKASVALPRSEFLAQNHIGTICTRVQFAAHQCPPRSIYGYARAYSPILDYQLAGPVYLRSSTHKLPDLVADLNGQIEVAVVGRIDTDKHGGIRTTFHSVPDAPVSKFVLQMAGGKKGLLQNSTNLCNGPHRATAFFEAHNGMSVRLQPQVKAPCRQNRKKSGKHSHRRHG